MDTLLLPWLLPTELDSHAIEFWFPDCRKYKNSPVETVWDDGEIHKFPETFMDVFTIPADVFS
jgi:hypothetical protein